MADIRRIFSEFGTVTVGRMTYVLDLRTRLAIGYVLVNVDDSANGQMAIQKLDGTVLTGNKIVVKLAG